MKLRYFLFILFLVTIISFQCKSPTSSEIDSPVLNGKVVDTHGHPVQNVDVHYIYSVPSSSLAKHENVQSSLAITFRVNKRSMVSLEIFRYFRNDSLGRIVFDTLNAGQYSYQVDISKFTNGLYIYRLVIDTTKVEKVFFCLNPDLSILLQSVPLAETNSNGEFSLPYGLLGFDYPLVRVAENGTVIDTTHISLSIQLVLHKTGYNTLMQSITIDPKKETDLTLTLVAP